MTSRRYSDKILVGIKSPDLFHHKSYDASYRSTTNSSVALRMQVMGKVMDFTVSRLYRNFPVRTVHDRCTNVCPYKMATLVIQSCTSRAIRTPVNAVNPAVHCGIQKCAERVWVARGFLLSSLNQGYPRRVFIQASRKARNGVATSTERSDLSQ